MIYLASTSAARKKLLRMCGVRFKAVPSRIREQHKASRASYAALVKRNALLKARAAAQKVKTGIIIGADTVSVQDGRIFGKPKNLRQARAMLKRFAQKPQWVYTGLAVIDKKRNKTLLACEKTKVYMDTLTDKEISAYFKKASVLDKAGSFDIQGRGALCIRRIEGCFYNVVGLPLAKLYRMLTQCGASLFCLLCACGIVTALSGCTTEYNIVTGKEETYWYSSEKEVQMGRSVANQIEKEYKLADDPLIQKRVQDIGKKIAAVADRKDIDYTFKVLDDDEVNAVSLPGGFIYVFKGVLDKVRNDDELAAVLAHEVGHVVARHSIKKLQAMTGYSVLMILASQAPQGADVANAAEAAFVTILLGYARDDELLADQLGARYTKAAGYNPAAMISFLQTLEDVNRRKPLRPKSYLKTHPYVPDRIRVVKQELGEKIDFTDYINIEQEKKL
ncbi:MAG: Maf family nucleotide pyrophosphatase [Candidatus Omnitrophota bacterium]